jgi:hypothetical protein
MAEPTSKKRFGAFAELGRSLLDHEGEFEDEQGVDRTQTRSLAELALPGPAAHFEKAQLLTEHTEGWHRPHPSALAVPSYAPAMTAFGVVFMALGAVTKWPLSVIGAVIFTVAIAKWIGELLHD